MFGAAVLQYGEQCGGWANEAGTCAGGLGCLIRYRPERGESEHNATGKCVTEQGEECSQPGSGVSCRPGQLGIPAEFVFCPRCPATRSAPAALDNSGILFSSPPPAPPPPLLSPLPGAGSAVTSLGETVRDTVRELLTGR